MRTLLFVQDGERKPVVVREKLLRYANGAVMWGPRMTFAKERADRWWLIECDNAEAGRWTLLKLGKARGPLFPTSFREGRIIASGGKS